MRYEHYPFSSLARLSHAQVRALRELRALSSGLALGAALETACSLLGTTLDVSAGLPEVGPDAFITRADARGAPPRAVWVELARTHGSLAVQLWIELPLGLAELLVDRLLGGDGALGVAGSAAAPDDMSLGALGYGVARVCATLGDGMALCGVDLHAPQPGASAAWVSRPLAVRVGRDSASVRLHARFGSNVGPTATAPVWQLREMPLVLWADAGHATLDLGTLRSLGRGDVIVLEHTGLVHERERFQGSVALRVLGSGTTVHCRAQTQSLEVERIACTPEASMSTGRRVSAQAEPEPAQGSARPELWAPARGSEAEDAPAGSDALASDAPIELHVELARFQLSLGELQRVQPGDVLVTGRRIGEAVTLRAAGRPFAEGELVDVEGEVGVRITRVLAQ